jgi:hypothetical protein
MRANGRVCRKRPAPARLHRGGVLFSRQRNYHCRSLDPFGDVQSGGDILRKHAQTILVRILNVFRVFDETVKIYLVTNAGWV